MASAQDLLSLMTQLRTLETSATTILMEAAMKLSALTDAEVFVLVQTQTERRFAGRRRLCDAFVAEGLRAAPGDVECSVDAAVSALRERRLSPGGFPGGGDVISSTPSATHFRSSAGGGSVRKRRLVTRPFEKSSPFKSARFDAAESDAAGDVMPFDLVDSKFCVDGIERKNAVASTGNGDVENDVAFPPQDAVDDDVIPLDCFDDKPSLDENGAWRSSDRDDALLPLPGTALMSPDESAWRRAEQNAWRPPIESPAVAVAASNRYPVMAYNGASSGSTLDCVNDVYPDTLLGKLAALDDFEVDMIFDPSLAPRKILNSILHEVGSKLALSCPCWPRELSNPRLKEFLILNIEAFVERFPVMRRICADKNKVFIGKKSMSKLTYVKNNIRSSYDKCFK